RDNRFDALTLDLCLGAEDGANARGVAFGLDLSQLGLILASCILVDCSNNLAIDLDAVDLQQPRACAPALHIRIQALPDLLGQIRPVAVYFENILSECVAIKYFARDLLGLMAHLIAKQPLPEDRISARLLDVKVHLLGQRLLGQGALWYALCREKRV